MTSEGMIKIPKKASRQLLEEVPTNSPRYKSDVLPELSNGLRSLRLQDLEIKKVLLVYNEVLSAKYNARKLQISSKTEEYAHLRVSDVDEAKFLCEGGIPVSSRLTRKPISVLGNPAMGVYLSKFFDYSSEFEIKPNEEVTIIMCRILKGKVKQVAESDSLFDPTPEFDCHVSKSALNGMVSSIQKHYTFHLSSQIYVYEYNSDFDAASFPSSILPYAVIQFARVPEDLSQNCIGLGNHIPSSVNGKPRTHGRVSMSSIDRPYKPLVVWEGEFSSWDQQKTQTFSHEAVLVSFYSKVPPVQLPRKLEVLGWIINEKVSNYFSEALFSPACPAISGVPQVQDGDVSSHTASYSAYFQLLSPQQLAECSKPPYAPPSVPFDQFFKNPFHREKAAVLKLPGSSALILYLFSPNSQTNRIGLSNASYNPPVLHALIVTNQVIYPSASMERNFVPRTSEFAVVGKPAKICESEEKHAFNTAPNEGEIPAHTSRMCNFAIGQHLASNRTLQMPTTFFYSEVLSNDFDMEFYLGDNIPSSAGNLIDRSIKMVQEEAERRQNASNAYSKSVMEKELRVAKENLKRQEEEHRKKATAAATAAAATAVTVSNNLPKPNALPKEAGLKKSFKRKPGDEPPAPTKKRKEEEAAAEVKRTSLFAAKPPGSQKRDFDNAFRRATPKGQLGFRSAEHARIDSVMPLNESSPAVQLPSGRPSLLDMPLPPPPVTSNRFPMKRHPTADVKPKIISRKNAASDNDMDISDSELHASSRSPDGPSIIEDENIDMDIDGVPIALGRKIATEVDDHPQLHSHSHSKLDKPPMREEAEEKFPEAPRRTLEATQMSKSSPRSLDRDVGSTSASRTGDIDLRRSTAVPEAPYVKPERPHFRTSLDNTGRQGNSKAFTIEDSRKSRFSDVPVKSVGNLTEYTHDEGRRNGESQDWARRNAPTTAYSGVRPNTGAHGPGPGVGPGARPGPPQVTLLKNRYGELVDINARNTNARDNPYKPPPSWRPDDPAVMCKNLTVSFHRNRVTRLGISLNPYDSPQPRFRDYRFTRHYVHDEMAIQRMERVIKESEERDRVRRQDEGGDESSRVANAGKKGPVDTEEEMRQLQRVLPRQRIQEDLDREEESRMQELLDITTSPQRSRGRDAHPIRDRSRDKERDRRGGDGGRRDQRQ